MIIREQQFIPNTFREREERNLDERKWDLDCIKPIEQIRVIERGETLGQECVQAFINNNSFPQTMEELDYFLEQFNVEMILSEADTEWTAPKWAKIGDVVFFMHTKTAITSITRLRTELNADKDFYDEEDYRALMSGIERGLELYRKYGGKIYALGRVNGGPEYYEPEEYEDIFHWKSRHYLKVDNIVRLENPIDISEFRDYIYVTRGATITPVFGEQYQKLMKTIAEKNDIPDYYKNCVSSPVPLRTINNDNWIEVSNKYRRAFNLESQFRTFYVDYLLRCIGDQKTFWKECRVTRSDIAPSFVDNIIKFKNKYLPVEVKLSVASEANIKAQLNKYCYNTSITLDANGRTITGADTYTGKVLVIDTYAIHMYDDRTKTLTQIFDLDNLKSFSDIQKIISIVLSSLG